MIHSSHIKQNFTQSSFLWCSFTLLIIIMAVYSLSSPKTNIDSTYVKIYYFNFFLIIRKNFAFFFRKFNLGEWLLRTFAEVITQFIHATTRTLISVHCQLLRQVQKLDSTILEKFNFSTFNYNEKPMSYPLLQLLRDFKFYSWKHIFLKFVF